MLIMKVTIIFLFFYCSSSLVVQLARDLQRDFLPYFEKFLLTIVKLLSIYNHEPEHLEHLMASLAYLFKFLWRYLIKDMPYVYRYELLQVCIITSMYHYRFALLQLYIITGMYFYRYVLLKV